MHLQSSGSLQALDSNEHPASSPTQETECLPEENVSIIEDMTTEDKLENMKAIVSGTMRRKLYFNPAYFEPHLLMVFSSGFFSFSLFQSNYFIYFIAFNYFSFFFEFSRRHRLQLNF